MKNYSLAALMMTTAVALAHAPPAQAQQAPPPDVVANKRLGVGYKIGNGLGFVGGDLIIAPVDHLTIDLQANYVSVSTGGARARGYGIAPSVQFHLFSGRSSPYVGLGFIRASISLDSVTASANGGFGNLGYEWRFQSGVGILLGGGVGYVGTIHATNGVETVDAPGGARFNIEAGLRYMFM